MSMSKSNIEEITKERYSGEPPETKVNMAQQSAAEKARGVEYNPL